MIVSEGKVRRGQRGNLSLFARFAEFRFLLSTLLAAFLRVQIVIRLVMILLFSCTGYAVLFHATYWQCDKRNKSDVTQVNAARTAEDVLLIDSARERDGVSHEQKTTVRLKGVVYARDAMAIVEISGEQNVYHQGDKLPDGRLVGLILPDRVILKPGNLNRDLLLAP